MVGWHRSFVADDVETARALIAEHVVDAENPRYCGSATHVYPGEWPCYRRGWAELVLHAEACGEIAEACGEIAEACGEIARGPGTDG